MDHYMPQIFWHDRKALLSVDIHPVINNNKYKIVTSSVQKEARIWEFEFELNQSCSGAPLSVSFIANLVGHNSVINQVKFSPSKESSLLASCDNDGRINIWQKNDSPPPPPQDELPPNKENWTRLKILNHDSDVNAMCWSPDGLQLASVSNDDCLCVHQALTGKRVFVVRSFRHFPNGVSWDPEGKYIVTMSGDRKMDIVDAVKGTRLRAFSCAELPFLTFPTSSGNVDLESKMYKLFHDDQLGSFQRGVAFSPRGEFIVAPCAQLELGSSDLFGNYLFLRSELASDAPAVFYPTQKATFLIKFSPLILDLCQASTNFLGLPYRLIWAALTKDCVYFYDSQHEHPIGIVENIHYNSLTDATWTSDGHVLVVSSLEGYCSFIKLKIDEWGIPYTQSIESPSSPNLLEARKRKKKIVLEEGASSPKPSPRTPQHPTPKHKTNMMKFLKKDVPTKNEQENTLSTENSPKPVEKKRIQLITLND